MIDDSLLVELNSKKYILLERKHIRPGYVRSTLAKIGHPRFNLSLLKPRAVGFGRSLSDEYGLGEFPLHTDGAHLDMPPDYLMFVAPKTRNTKTLLADPSYVFESYFEAARDAIFYVQRRSNTYSVRFCFEKNGVRCFRYNESIMMPANPAANEVRKQMRKLRDYAVRVDWNRYALLIFNNRTMVHGRGRIEDTRSHLWRFEVKLP